MGGLLSIGSLACCCGSAACSLCACCPSCKNSTSARIMYAILLLLTTVVSCILLAPGLQDSLKKVPFCKDSSATDDRNLIEKALAPQVDGLQFDCKNAVGYLAVYRYANH